MQLPHDRGAGSKLLSCGFAAKVYILENDSIDCTRAAVLAARDRLAGNCDVVLVPSHTRYTFLWSRERFMALADESLQRRRYEQMSALRQQLVDAIKADTDFGASVILQFDPDQDGGWASSSIVEAIGAVSRGEYDAICANGGRLSDHHIWSHYDILALRVADFDDMPNEMIEIAASGPEFDSGKVRVSACFGGLTIYTAAIFAECRYARSAATRGLHQDWDCEHVMLARCMAAHGRSLHIFPNLLIRASSGNLQHTTTGGTPTCRPQCSKPKNTARNQTCGWPVCRGCERCSGHGKNRESGGHGSKVQL